MGRLASELWGNNGMGMASPAPATDPPLSPGVAAAAEDTESSHSTSRTAGAATPDDSATAAVASCISSSNDAATAASDDASRDDTYKTEKKLAAAVGDKNDKSSPSVDKELEKNRPIEATRRIESGLLQQKPLYFKGESSSDYLIVGSATAHPLASTSNNQRGGGGGGNEIPGAYPMEHDTNSNETTSNDATLPTQRVASESATTTNQHHRPVLSAHLVTDEENAEKLRERIQELENAPTALVVLDPADEKLINHRLNTAQRKMTLAIFILVTIIVVILVLVLLAATGIFQLDSDDTALTTTITINPPLTPTIVDPPLNNSTPQQQQEQQPTGLLLKPTLQTIKERGHIRCRVIPMEYDSGGISQELCRALSAAIFDGDPNRTQFVLLPISQMWSSVDDGSVDIATSWNTGTIGRDVFESYSGQPKSFSTSYFITGTQVAGSQQFVNCVNHQDTITGVCKDLVICVPQHTTTFDVISQHMDGSGLHRVDNISELFEGLTHGICNVVAGEPQYIYEARARDAGYTGEYVFGSSLLSTEPQCMTTRENDPQWTDFSTSVLQALFTAELENITKENATELFPTTNLFGEEYQHMYQQVISAMGNWGNIFEQTFGQYIPRNAVNQVKKKNTGNSNNKGGLLYSPPLAALEYTPQPHYTNPPRPIPNGTLETITNRGYVRCAIVPNRPGFAKETTPNTSTGDGQALWTGMDIDICSCLAIALFRDQTKVHFVVVEDPIAGFMAIAEDLADVVAGIPYTLQGDIREPSTNRGYTFSPTYFYNDDDGGERLAMVTNQDATQWSDFVRWIIYGLISAEEQGVDHSAASKMPSVDLFGPHFTLMFRLIVLNMGNYGELYERNLESLIPRQGSSNVLNNGSTPLINPLPLGQFA